LQRLFEGLKNSIGEQISTLGELLTSLQTLRKAVATDAASFSDKNASFKQLEELDKKNLLSARKELDKIKSMIKEFDQEIDVDIIKSNRDLAIASNAMKYGKMFGDPGTALGLTIGLVFIASVSFTIDDLLATINRRLALARKEAEYELEMTSLTTQLISLETASSALASVVEEIDDLIASLEATIAGWNMDSKEMSAVIAALGGDQPINSIISQFDLGETQAEWDEIRIFATKWQTLEISPRPTNELVLSGSDTKLATARS
jgi:hypothetical protein